MKTPMLDLGSTPLADQFPETPAEALAQERYPLGLTVDDQSWTVELTHLVPDELLFGDDYAFTTGSSPALKSYFSDYADWVYTRFGSEVFLEGVCEIACNDGTLLEHFRGYRHLGVDPAKPAVTEARRKGLIVTNKAFDLDLAHEIDETFGVVIANNVAAHVPSLEDLLAGISHLIRDGGYGIVEFQYVGDLISDCLWPVVYHEHRRFLSLTSFEAAMPPEMRVVDVAKTPAQGGSLRVVVSRRTSPPRSITAMDLLYAEGWLRRTNAYTSLQGRVEYQVDRLRDAVASFSSVALIGASAKATTLVHYAGLEGQIDYVVDLTPHKIGRYLPGTNIPVIGPEQANDPDAFIPTAYLVSVANYLPRIIQQEYEYLANGGHLILPDGTVI